MSRYQLIETEIEKFKEALKGLEATAALMELAMQDGINVQGALSSYTGSVANVEYRFEKLKEVL